jgi:uncharacterized Zn finger protein (UPF0148 family)
MYPSGHCPDCGGVIHKDDDGKVRCDTCDLEVGEESLDSSPHTERSVGRRVVRPLPHSAGKSIDSTYVSSTPVAPVSLSYVQYE